jgi:hypothetical protein
MNNDPQKPDESIFKEVIKPGYVQLAQERAQQHKNRWTILVMLLFLAAVPSFWYLQFRGMWFVHTIFYPEHTGRISEFWNRNIAIQSFISSFMLTIPLCVGSIPLAGITANLIVWCIPPARRTMDRKTKGNLCLCFSSSNKLFFKAALFVIPICLLVSLIGAATLKTLR